jgi:catechol 2,3-dioxygenase-like lactoylglutathione lyase family enzyme
VPDELVPVFRVEDGRAAATWYQRLGFVVAGEHRFAPDLPLYVLIRRRGVSLHLSEHSGDAPPRSLAYFYVDDLDAIAEDFRAEIVIQPWGREIELADPSGNRLRIGSVRSRP